MEMFMAYFAAMKEKSKVPMSPMISLGKDIQECYC